MKKFLVIFFLMASLFAADKAPWYRVFPQKDLSGNPIIYDKAVYVVDVWATWCPPCRLTVPELIALQSQLSVESFSVIGLSVDEISDEELLAFVTKENINYPVAKAGKAMQFLPPVRGIPTMFILDKNGKIKKTFVGYMKKDALLKEVKKVLVNEVH